MELRVIETVTFKLADGVSDTQFMGATRAVTKFLQGCNGFKRRCLSKGENDNWLEHVEWESMRDAKAASDAFMKEESLYPYMQSIDLDSVKMEHQKLYHLSAQKLFEFA